MGDKSAFVGGMKLKISELGKVITGNTPSKKIKEFWDKDDVGFVKPDIISDEHIVRIKSEDCNEFISNTAISKARIVPKNSIFVTCIGNIGKIGVATENLAFNQQINAIIPHENVNLDYLSYAIFANKAKLQDIANAPIVPLLNKSQFSEFELDLDMDINTQERIVHELNTVSNIILKYKQELLLLDELVRARFVEMFGDSITNDKNLKLISLFDLSVLKAGKSIKTGELSETYDDETLMYPCFGGNGIRGYINRYSHDGNYPIIGRQGAWAGNVNYATGKFYATEHAIVVTPKVDLNTVWYYYGLKYLDLTRFQTGAAQPGLAVDKLNKVFIPFPAIELQNQFASFVEEIDKSRLLSNHSLFLIKSIIF